MTERNWAGNYTYKAAMFHRPSTVEQLQHVLASAPRIRVLGSRHSFTGLADSAELVALDGLPEEILVDNDRRTVTVAGAVTYGRLAKELDVHNAALPNLGSLPHVSVAGSVATATHGSGDDNGNLATSVDGLEMVTSSGDFLTSSRGDPDYDGLVVGLGALGAVTRVTLQIEPAYRVRQRVFEGLDWDVLFDNFDEVTSAGYSVSLFTSWGRDVEQVWVKQRDIGETEQTRADFFGARPATEHRHPIPGLDPNNCTRQLGEPGPWFDRLPHFRMGFVPSSGHELQSEYLVPRANALPALEAVRGLANRIRPLLHVSEIRSVARDHLWMSPQYECDTIGIHFTWKPRPREVEGALVEIEGALAPFEARPHWGKLFLGSATTVGARYKRISDFSQLARRLDSRAAFHNAWMDAHVFQLE